MLTPTHRIYVLVLKPEEVNGRLCAHENKLLLNLRNYTELLVAAPAALTDERLQVFEVEVPVDLVRVQQDGDRTVHILWAGEKQSKSRPGDLVTVSVRSQIGFISDAAAALDAAGVARATFAGFAPAVQLAATVLNLDDATLKAAGVDPAAVKAWAQQQVAATATA